MKCLQMSFPPTDALAEGNGQLFRLFIEELRIILIRDSVSSSHSIGAEGAVFGQVGVIPAVCNQFVGKQVSCSLNPTGKAEHGFGAVFTAGSSQPVDGVGRGDTTVPPVFCVSIRGNDPFTGVECPVHLFHIVRLENIVRVKDQISVKRADTVVPVEFPEQILKCKAFGLAIGIKSLVTDGAVLAGNLRSMIGAVVGNHKDRHQFLRVSLLMQTLEELADDICLVSGSDQNRIAMIMFCLRELPDGEKAHDHENAHVGVGST